MTPQHRPLAAIVFIAACAIQPWAQAQNGSKVASSPHSGPCLTAKQLAAPHIYGAWRVRFNPAPAGLPGEALMRLEKHAEFSESVAGAVTRTLATTVKGGHAPRAQLAGDIENGFLTLDESSNGVSITGTWNGELVEGSCGKQFKGTWKDTSDNAAPDTPDIAFTLEKMPEGQR